MNVWLEVTLAMTMPHAMILLGDMNVPATLGSLVMGSTAQVHRCNCNCLYTIGANPKRIYLVLMAIFIHLDIDECYMDAHSCNASTSFCVNAFGTYTCDCLQGFNKTLGGVCTCEIFYYGC